MLCFVISALLLFSTCTDAFPSEPYILYSNITNLHTLDLTTYARSDVLGGKDRIIPLGFDSVNQHVYFGEHQLGRIYRSSYDGSGVTLIMEDVENVEGVAIDWIGGLIYWTTYTSETIEVATLNGQYRAVVINAGLEYPRGIAVDPIAGYLFWSDWGTAAAIERSSLDGSNRVSLVTSNITWPNGVTLDTTQRLVYWIDAYHDTVSSVDYDGNKRRLIFEDTPLSLSKFHGFDLDINGDNLYFTDWLANAIYEVKISSGAIIRNISVPTTNSIKGAMGLRIIDRNKQLFVTNNCGNTNGGCEQLCFHKVPTGTVCKCQLGMKLASDNKSCEDAFKDEFIMFADADAGKIYQMQLDSMNVKPIAIPFDPKSVNISRPVALDHDSKDDRVYWTDVTLQTIARSFRNGSHFELLYDNFGVADGLAIDFAAGLLYWTSTTNNTVEASKLDGSNRRTLVRWNLDEPRDIILDPISGYMYWTDWGRLPRIERAHMNGENRHDLVNTTIQWPNGLTLDHVYNKLYWADAREDNIEVIDLATLERKVVLNQKLLFFGYLFGLTTKVNHPYGLTLLHDKLYWTDWNTDAVYRADVNTGANIVLMAGNLGKPMDIHAYISVPKQQKRIHYTFSFPNNKGSNFTCISSRSCPQMDPPPACPPGYTEVRENKTCGLNCRDIVGYTWRCPCDDWMSCAVKERYLWGCAYGYYSSFRVRECEQVVRAGRCPSGGTPGSQSSCNRDIDCPNGEKCCNSKCATIATIETHLCRTNNGGCDQLCFSVPGGRKCGCRNGFFYNETLSKCVIDTRPSPTPPPTPPPLGCAPHPAPKNGSVDCGGQDPVPKFGSCYFSCDPGFELVGYSWDMCYNGEWIDETPTCEIDTSPKFSFCPNDTTVPTDPGKAYATVNWTVPIATDVNGTELPVEIWPPGYDPPVKLAIGWHYLDVYAIDKNGDDVYCYFYITVEDQEPPSFNSTCPQDIVLYTDNDFAIKLPPSFREPTATDNAKPPSVYRTGFPADSFFPIGRTVVSYTARDAAGLNSSCIFSVTVVNVCRGVTCTHGAECVLDVSTGNSHICKCNSFCPQKYDPVCGSDGQTYVSECIMNVSSCLSKRDVTVVSKGPCTTAETCDRLTCEYGETCSVIDGKAQCSCIFACPEKLDYVCGSDFVDYQNECKMRESACRRKKNITVLAKGICTKACDGLNCEHGETCSAIMGKIQCSCIFACSNESNHVCGSDAVDYQNECKMRESACRKKKNITVHAKGKCGDCNRLNCSAFGAACQVENGLAKCECDFACADPGPVCGSDGKTYPSRCHLRRERCAEQKDIKFVFEDKGCGCDDLDLNGDDTSTVECKENTNNKAVECTIICKPGYKSAIPNFLKLQCYNKKWIRANNIGNFVPLASSPPQCYKPKNTQSGCSNGFGLLSPQGMCVQCPPGSYKGAANSNCTSCEPAMYQDKSGQSSCKKCSSTDNSKTSTTTGAENCYFDYSQNAVKLTFEKKLSDFKAESIREEVAKGLTELCEKEECNFVDNTASRKRRAEESHTFKAENIIILSIQDVSNNDANAETVIELLVLDPSSTSLLPNSAFSSEDLVKYIKILQVQGKFKNLKSVDRDRGSKTSASSGGSSSSKAPIVAGVIVAIVVIAFAVCAVWLYHRRRRNKNSVPPVQFNSAGEGGMQIGNPTPAVSSPEYENPQAIQDGLQHGFVNQVYNDVQAPPPYYETPSPNVYDTPEQQVAGALPTKEKMPDNAVVDIIPPKDAVGYETPIQADPPKKFFHKRNTLPNDYQQPRSTTPDGEADLKLEPPPKFDDAKLQVMRSSILPNVPRKKVDPNANITTAEEGTSRSDRHHVGDVTKEQSET